MYNNEQLKNELLLGYDFAVDTFYNENIGVYGNWYHWEIAAPMSLENGLIILFDELSAERIEKYMRPVDKFVHDPSVKSTTTLGAPSQMTGANLSFKVMNFAMAGVIQQNSSKLNTVKSKLKQLFVYANNVTAEQGDNDGFWQDGSYIQHYYIPYTSGYGADLYRDLGIFFYVFSGSNWEIKYDDKSEYIPCNAIFDGIEPLLYNNLFMDMTAGREPSRPNRSDFSAGLKILLRLIPFADAMPDSEMKTRFERMIKYYVGLDEDEFYKNAPSIYTILKVKSIMQDTNILPRSEYIMHKHFASMDRVVHTMKDYSFGLAMHSKRIYNYEIINNEGKRMWNTSDGMTYLYDNDRQQYADGYWCNIDPRRLPGTTSEYVMRADGAGAHLFNSNYFTSGTSLDNRYGVAGMDLKTLGSGKSKDGTSAKKSWFMFDDEIIAVGTGITSNTGNFVETIIDNRKIDKDLTNAVTVNGVVRDDIIDNSQDNIEPKGKEIENVNYIHLKGSNNSNIGYYFPEMSNVKVLKESRTNDWNEVGIFSGETTNGFATFTFNHGKNPQQQSYSYVILPNKTAEQTSLYANSNKDFEIVEKTDIMHAVKIESKGIFAANIWNKTDDFVQGIKTNGAASLMIRSVDDTIEFSVEEPTQIMSKLIVEYQGETKKVISCDDAVNVTSSDGITRLTIDTKNSYGKSYNIILSTNQNVVGDDIPPLEVVDPSAQDIYVNDNFDELSQANNSYVVKQQGTTPQTITIGNITYTAAARTSGGDNTTGIKVGTNGTDKYIIGISGQFSNANRNSWITFNNVKKFSEISNKAFMMNFDVMMKSSQGRVDFSDGTKTVFSLLNDANGILNITNGSSWVVLNGVTSDKWCNIKITANQTNDKYSIVAECDGKIVYTGENIFVNSGAESISRIDFGKNDSKANFGEIAYLNNLSIVAGNAAPIISPILENNMHDMDIEYTFSDNEDWREKVNKIVVNDNQLTPEQYNLIQGQLIINKEVFSNEGIYTIVISAENYPDVTIVQTICANISGVDSLTDITVNMGTRLEDVKTLLPSSVTINLSNGRKITATPVWNENSQPEYDLNGGEFTFGANLSGLPEYIINTNNIKVSQLVKVIIPNNTNISSIDKIENIECEVTNKFPTISSVVEDKFPKRVTVNLEDNTTYSADVKWNSKDIQADDKADEGEYIFEAELINLPKYITNTNNVGITVSLVMKKMQV